MKITAILLFVACLHVSANGITQTINLSFRNAPLEQVLKDIEKQTGYTFFYRTNWLKQAKRVTVEANNLTLQAALDLCFKGQPIDYSISGKIITVALREGKAQVGESILSTGASTNLITVKGKIVGENGMGLGEVSVIVKGTSNGTTTDANGNFFLYNIPESSILVITSVGYIKEELPIDGKSSVTVQLKVSVANLDEVQFVAYGSTTRRMNTGNVSTIKSSEIQAQPVNNPLLALQGRATGINITQTNGLPGAGVRVQIRGQNSIAHGNEPLYIIDGVPYTSLNLSSPIRFILGSSSSSGEYSSGNPLSYINPADIESIDILKDAAATAIYGSRGANGVILITTKKGKSGGLKFDLNIQKGWGTVARKLKLLNTQQYLEMRYEAFQNDNAVPNPNADYDLTLWDTARYTDWQEELIGRAAQYDDIQLAVNGGNEYTQYRLAAGYHRETTVFPGDFNDIKPTAQFSVNGTSPNKKFKLSLSGIFTKDINNLSSYDFTEQAIKLPPNAPALYNDDGSINWAPNHNGVSSWPYAHPVSMMMMRFKSKTNNLISNAIVSYKIAKGLELKSSFGYNFLQSDDIKKEPLAAKDPSTWATAQRFAHFFNSSIESWIIEPQISYSTKIRKGNLSALAGGTIQQIRNKSQFYSATGFNSDLVLEDIGSATSVTAYPGVNSVYKYNAVFGKINYNWDEKYLIDLTARKDGTSRFGPANRFNNFWGIGLGWIFSNEDFIRNKLSVLNYGKLRFSYGTTGSDQVGDYTYMDLYSPVVTGVSYQGATGVRPSRIFTPDLAWEETRKLEAGLELSFLNDRLALNTSFYRNTSTNQLISYPIPSITGFTSLQKNLNALVENKGVEIELRAVLVNIKNFSWTSSANLSLNRNKLVSGPDDLGTSFTQKIGLPLASAFVYRYNGVNIINGLYEFLDANGNPTSNPDPVFDKTMYVDFSPKYLGGFKNSFSWKSIQLDALFQFVNQPNAILYLYNSIPGSVSRFAGSNQPVTVLDRWRKPGDVKGIQRFSQNTSTLTSREFDQQSNHAYGNGSYVRLKNISITYQLPQNWMKKAGLDNARIFAHGQNLFTVTDFQGLDPESAGSAVSLPPLRVITCGIQLSL